MLQALLKDEMKKRDMSTRQVAEAIGDVSHTTIIRALKGDDVDLGTLIKLSEWLGVRPHTLLNSMASSSISLADKISIVLERHPSLAKEFSKAIELIVQEKTSPAIIEDIATYAAYKMNLSGKHP